MMKGTKSLFWRGLGLAAVLASLLVSCANPFGQVSPGAQSAQAAVSRAAMAGPADDSWNNATNIYQVYVTKFTPEGTISALKDKIPYLKDLGVKSIWLMPIFQSMSDHGYDATDYYAIKSNLGSNEDFRILCETAHTAGIRVILDLVINHTGSNHPWFNGNDGQRHDNWYCWSSYNKGWKEPWDYSGQSGTTWYYDGTGRNRGYYYGAFSSSQPDLNWNDPTARSQLINEVSNIMSFWVNLGADGFRCDAARYLVENAQSAYDVGQGKNRDQPETHAIWASLRSRLTQIEPRAILLAESPTESYSELNKYYGTIGSLEFQSAFHFMYSGVLMDSLKNGYRNSKFFSDLFAVQSFLPFDTALNRLRGQDAIFLSNHDRFTGDRVASQLGMGYGSYTNDGTATAKTKLAASVLLTLSGNPTIYYGDEYGAINTSTASGDEPIRGAFDWSRAGSQQATPGSIYKHYKGLLNIRNVYDSLRGGRSIAVPSTANGSAQDDINSSSNRMVFYREYYGELALVIHNPTGANLDIRANLSAAGMPAVANNTPVYALMGGGSYPAVTSANIASYPVGTVAAYCSKVLFIGDVTAKYGSNYATYEGQSTGPKTNYGSMYLRGTMNGWTASAMTLTKDYTWELSVPLAANTAYSYKYDAYANWAGTSNWGSSAVAGIAALGGGNIAFTSTTAGNYTFVFNEQSLAYDVIGGGPAQCATPTFNPPAGQIAANTEITISSTTSGSTIYYTLDGSAPSTASNKGADGAGFAKVTVSPSVTIKAIAVKAGMLDSAVGSASYTPITGNPGRLTVIFKTGSNAENVTFPGDANNWSLTANTKSVGPNSSTSLYWDGAITSTVMARGNSTSAIELKLCNTASGWNGQWGFGSWNKSSNITLGDNGRQIMINCSANQEVTLTIDVSTTSLSAVIK